MIDSLHLIRQITVCQDTGKEWKHLSEECEVCNFLDNCNFTRFSYLFLLCYFGADRTGSWMFSVKRSLLHSPRIFLFCRYAFLLLSLFFLLKNTVKEHEEFQLAPHAAHPGLNICNKILIFQLHVYFSINVPQHYLFVSLSIILDTPSFLVIQPPQGGLHSNIIKFKTFIKHDHSKHHANRSTIL